MKSSLDILKPKPNATGIISFLDIQVLVNSADQDRTTSSCAVGSGSSVFQLTATSKEEPITCISSNFTST